MIFIIIAVIGLISMKILVDKGADSRTGSIIFILELIIVAIGLKMSNLSAETKLEIKKSHISIAEQYESSYKTGEEWEKTKEMLQEINEKAKNAESIKAFYVCVDPQYAISLLFGSSSFEEYQVTISDDRIVFPEHYKKSDLLKDIKYKLIPVD
ncbi:MAG: hypothetical protein J6A58_13960 [Oscillospiraceae bacterium]|nr:hypothetical protein [Ruminococcus sp.]MBP1566844.1 hypothetical protein [Oscillospiraceae bacterium]